MDETQSAAIPEIAPEFSDITGTEPVGIDSETVTSTVEPEAA